MEEIFILLLLVPLILGYLFFYGIALLFITIERIIKAIRIEHVILSIIILGGFLIIPYWLKEKHNYQKITYIPTSNTTSSNENEQFRQIGGGKHDTSVNTAIDCTVLTNLPDYTTIDSVNTESIPITPIWEKIKIRGLLTTVLKETKLYNGKKEQKFCYILKLNDPIYIFTGLDYEIINEIQIIEDRGLLISDFIGLNIEVECTLKPSTYPECGKVETTNYHHREKNYYQKIDYAE